MKTKTKPTPIAQWMEANKLTIDDLARALRYSHGTAAKWRQGLTYPTGRAVEDINKAGAKRNWTPFPARAEA